MKPIQWVSLLLKRHGLDKPDGRPLYQYRVTDDEYDELTRSLKLSALLGVNNIITLLLWDAAFVIYASEWWRREYNGKWGWSDLFKTINIDVQELSVNRRNTLIETGLQRWRRDIRNNNGTRQLLGTIATEGGLPLHQLSDSGGWLEDVLKPVLKKHVAREISISSLISNYQNLIPKSYRSAEINQILADIVQAVIHLRQSHQLMDRDRPLKWLDEKQPDWREIFPIPIDNESGRTLLRGLVDVASKVRKDIDTKNPFEVERYLIKAGSANHELIALLEIPTFISLESISLNSEITSNLHVEVYDFEGNSWPWCRAYPTIQGDKKLLKLSGRALKIENHFATNGLRIRFKSLGKVIHEIDPINGQSVDCSVPSLFKLVDSRWKLYGTSSQSIKTESAIVYIPNSFTCKQANELTELNQAGSIFFGNLYQLKGTIYCYFENDQYRFSTDSQKSLIQYKLSGKKFSYGSNPSDVFIGIPDLHETNLENGSSAKKHGGILEAKPIGNGGNWTTLSQAGSGCYEVRHKDNAGNILFRRRIGILPKEFLYRLLPGDSPEEGSLQFKGISNYQFNINSEDITTRIDHDNSKVNLCMASTGLPPMFVNVSLLPTNHHKEILLNFPYPSKGALLFDPTERQCEFSNHLFLSDLQGYRIKVYSSKTRASRNIDLRFSLRDSVISTESLRDIYIQKNVGLDAGVTEFSIYDWMEPISDLMGVSSSLDSFVEISMLSQGQELFNLKIYRYEKEMIPDWENGTIKLETNALIEIPYDTLEGTQLSALFLNQPEQANILLEQKRSGGAVTGEWILPISNLELGPWLVYPTEDSHLKFRPLVWNIGDYIDIEDNYNNINTLQKAVRIKEQNLREQPIRNILRIMASDFNHKSWGYIKNLWDKTSHLPIVVFDIWKIAISEPKFLASLLVQDNKGITTRLEEELPVNWELVHLSDWEASLMAYKNKLSIALGENENNIINRLLEKKINEIESLSDSMLSIGQILRVKLFDKTSPELKALKGPSSICLDGLLDSEFQQLIKQSGNWHWPEVLSNLIISKLNELPEEYTSLLTSRVKNKFQVSVVILPMIIAWITIKGNDYDWPDDAVELFKIDLLKSFNEDWFNAAFRLLSSWLSQNKIETK